MRCIRRGATLLELALVMVIIGILAAIAVPRSAALIDAFGVRGASQDVVLALAAARRERRCAETTPCSAPTPEPVASPS